MDICLFSNRQEQPRKRKFVRLFCNYQEEPKTRTFVCFLIAKNSQEEGCVVVCFFVCFVIVKNTQEQGYLFCTCQKQSRTRIFSSSNCEEQPRTRIFVCFVVVNNSQGQGCLLVCFVVAKNKDFCLLVVIVKNR